MEDIEDTIGVDSHGTASRRAVCSVATSRVCELANWGRLHDAVGLFVGSLDAQGATLASDSLSDVDAGLGGVAGLSRIDCMLDRALVSSVVRVGPVPLRIGAAGVVSLVGLRGSGVAVFGRGIARRVLQDTAADGVIQNDVAVCDSLALALGGS